MMAERVGKLILVLALAAGGAAVAGEAAQPAPPVQTVQIALPESDLVTSKKPFVATVVMPATLGDARVTAAVELRRSEPGLESVPIAASVALTPAKADGGATCGLAHDATALAEGEYAGTITVSAGDAKQSVPFTMFRMAEGRPKDFPYGSYGAYFRSK